MHAHLSPHGVPSGRNPFCLLAGAGPGRGASGWRRCRCGFGRLCRRHSIMHASRGLDAGSLRMMLTVAVIACRYCRVWVRMAVCPGARQGEVAALRRDPGHVRVVCFPSWPMDSRGLGWAACRALARCLSSSWSSCAPYCWSLPSWRPACQGRDSIALRRAPCGHRGGRRPLGALADSAWPQSFLRRSPWQWLASVGWCPVKGSSASGTGRKGTSASGTGH